MIAPPTVAARPHRVWLQKPGPPVPTDDGGWEQSWIDLSPPRMFSKIEPASAVDMERVFSDGAIISSASHVVKMPFHAAMTTKVRWLMRMGPLLPKITFANYARAGETADQIGRASCRERVSSPV